jgi:hypothetical protein
VIVIVIVIVVVIVVVTAIDRQLARDNPSTV